MSENATCNSQESLQKRRRLHAMRRDAETCMRVGMNVLNALLDHDRAEVYIVERGTVRTRPVQSGDHMDVRAE